MPSADSYPLVPARYGLPIGSKSAGTIPVDHIAMKKPATPISIAAQDPIRTVEAAPVWVATLPATVLVVCDGMTSEPLKAEMEVELVITVGAAATVVLKTMLPEV